MSSRPERQLCLLRLFLLVYEDNPVRDCPFFAKIEIDGLGVDGVCCDSQIAKMLLAFHDI